MSFAVICRSSLRHSLSFSRSFFASQHIMCRSSFSSKITESPADSTTYKSGVWLRKQQTFWEGRYKAEKEKNPATDELMRFLLKNIFYGSAAAFAAYLFKEYVDTDKRLAQIEIIVDKQIRENTVALEKMRALRVQPLLYLTTQITENDVKTYQENRTEFVLCMNQLKNHEKELEQHLLSYGFCYKKINRLQKNISQQIEQLQLASLFNETIWLQKNRQYEIAMQKNNETIEKLQDYQARNISTYFPLASMLAAVYNTQAKLQACLAFFSEKDDAINSYRKASVASYDQAIAILKNGNGDLTELAILLSSQAYLFNDLCDPEQALTLRREANRLKPNDVHIVCGIGLDLYAIEQKKKEKDPQKKFDFEKLEDAHAYFTYALQLNDKFANVYVYRGRLLLAMDQPAKAQLDFEHALKINPTHSDAHLELAYLLFQQGHCDLAEEHFKLGMLPLFERPHHIKKQKEKFLDIQKMKKITCCALGNDLFFKSSSLEALSSEKSKMSDEKRRNTWFKFC